MRPHAPRRIFNVTLDLQLIEPLFRRKLSIERHALAFDCRKISRGQKLHERELKLPPLFRGGRHGGDFLGEARFAQEHRPTLRDVEFKKLQSTGAYHTRALAGDRADWPKVPLAITMHNVPTLEAVNRRSLLEAGEALGLRKTIGERELNSMMAALPRALNKIIQEVSDENSRLPKAAMRFLTGELRLLTTLQHLVIPETLARLR